ncbi:hypothetical protein DFH08DRAFT_959636 [Mycena albidolilacea]|uniref:Uncharacterized protein n=1 Tax=Mycena albidolilacea TaxID=1033008 RepID=A0AAD7ESF0_9AGAR|nr:hypothetical protein DFH08DRAFT_959636 [Mycena albidolilacea]
MSQPVVRKKSMCIPAKSLKAPIPPSLVHSPHLNSPQSIFRRATSPRAPPHVDDEWLQDTVPQRGALKPPRETKISAEPAHRPSQSLQRPFATPGGRPPLPSWHTEPNIQHLRSPAEQDGYFVGFSST